MSIPFNNLTQFILVLLFGVTMIAEALLIGVLHKQKIPLPSRILYWISVGLFGKERSTHWFTGKNTPENLRAYALIVSLFGVCLVVTSFIHLDGILAKGIG